MKKAMILLLAVLMLFSMVSAVAETTGKTLLPLPDSTMEALDDSIVAVSLEKGDAYLDENGKMFMTLGIYSYDKYDMVDVAALEVGDIILHMGEEVAVTSLDEGEYGEILINGGMDMDGITLITDESGVYYAHDFNDAKHWYLIGYADYTVSDDFTYTDSSDLEKEEPAVFYAGDFLSDTEDIDYFFYPDSTTVRIEAGEIVAMERVYTP